MHQLVNWKSEHGSQQNCSVQRLVSLNIGHIVRECLFGFPYTWASVLLLIDGSCLHASYFQPPVGESQFLTYDFSLDDLLTLMVIIVCKPAVCHHISPS